MNLWRRAANDAEIWVGAPEVVRDVFAVAVSLAASMELY